LSLVEKCKFLAHVLTWKCIPLDRKTDDIFFLRSSYKNNFTHPVVIQRCSCFGGGNGNRGWDGGWHHWLDGHEFEQAPGVGDGQESLACCSP